VALDTGTPYALPFPVDSDVANVPLHVRNLAERIELMLDTKMQKTNWTNSAGVAQTGADGLYQTKIKIQTSAPAANATGTDGDIIFVVG
jgi:hypothetical protein